MEVQQTSQGVSSEAGQPSSTNGTAITVALSKLLNLSVPQVSQMEKRTTETLGLL